MKQNLEQTWNIQGRMRGSLSYYEDNHFTVSSSKKFDNARYLVMLALDKLPKDKDSFLESFGNLKPALGYILYRFRKDNIHQGIDPDFRPGAETYGFDNWEDNLSYISDRWMTEFRIQWLIDLIEYLEAQEEEEEEEGRKHEKVLPVNI